MASECLLLVDVKPVSLRCSFFILVALLIIGALYLDTARAERVQGEICLFIRSSYNILLDAALLQVEIARTERYPSKRTKPLLLTFPAQLVESVKLLRFYPQRPSRQKPRSHASSCPHFYSRVGFNIPTVRRFSSTVATSNSRSACGEPTNQETNDAHGTQNTNNTETT